MTYCSRIGLVVVLASLSAWAVSAQVIPQFRARPVDPPVVLSGDDLGFRVEGMEGNAPVGTLVVRVNDEWVEVKFGGGVASLGSN